MKNNIILRYLVLLISTLILNVYCGTVTTDKNVVTVKKGSTAIFIWTITVGADETLGPITISNGTYIENDKSNRLWKDKVTKLYPKTKEIFGDRFEVDDTVLGEIKVTIRSINYTEAMTLNVRAVFLKGLSGSEAKSNIQVQVEDTPTTAGPKADDDDDGSSGSNIGGIVGGVVAAVVVLAVIIAIIYYRSMRKRPNKKNNRTGSCEEGFMYHKEQAQYAKPEEVLPPPEKTKQPENKKYDELGPGGRTGPKDHVVRSEYAQVKEADSEPEDDSNMVSDSIIV